MGLCNDKLKKGLNKKEIKRLENLQAVSVVIEQPTKKMPTVDYFLGKKKKVQVVFRENDGQNIKDQGILTRFTGTVTSARHVEERE